MTIKNQTAFMDGIWDWGILSGCFGDTQIAPTDIDGFVERNGKFLILETKAPGVEVKTGQEITFNALVRIAGAVVIVIWGNRGNPERIKVYSQKEPKGKEYDNADMSTLRWLVKTWFQMADSA